MAAFFSTLDHADERASSLYSYQLLEPLNRDFEGLIERLLDMILVRQR